MPTTPPSTRSISSSQKVRNYLFDELQRDTQAQFPPIRDIAKTLNVSTATVHHVYKDLRKEGLIETTVGRGTFWAQAVTPSTEEKRYCVVLDSGQLNFQNSPLGLLWLESIFRASNAGGRCISLQSISSQSEESDGLSKDLLRAVDDHSVHGLILFRSRITRPTLQKILTLYRKAGKPIMMINPRDVQATANFVSTDHLGSSRKIGQAFGSTGRRRVILLIHDSLHHSSTFLPRFSGLQLGLSEAGCPVNDILRVVIAKGIKETDGYDAIRAELLRGAPPPDAIYCMGDYLAVGAITALQEAGRRVPDDTSVIGGTGMNFPGQQALNLTQLCHPIDKFGEVLIDTLLYRVKNHGIDVPGIYIPPTFRLGNTTRPEENALLGTTA